MTSYVINKGHRLRITVTSSFWPFYSVRPPATPNLSTRLDWGLWLSVRTVSQANPNTGAALSIPPVSNHTIWPPWPDHTRNVTARVNTTACKRLLSLGCVAHTDGAVLQACRARR